MSDIWYNEIAKRNNGYITTAMFSQVGISGEDVFSKRLLKIIKTDYIVLDAGCGHGDFSIKIAKKVKSLSGFDFSEEMIKIANKLKQDEKANNVEFLFASTKAKLPYENERFDLIYSRRGPTSIIDHPNLLKKGGTIIGIHSGAMEKIKDRLTHNGFSKIEIEEFDNSYLIFEDEKEYIKYLSDFPGNPNYGKGENKDELEELIQKNKIEGKIKIKEWRFIWMAKTK